MFIQMEGIDACGKDTHGEILAERLKARILRFPDRNTVMGKVINRMLKGELWLDERADPYVNELDGGTLERSQAVVLQGLMVANRLEWMPAIKEMRKARQPIVAIRYWASGYAYGRADGLDGKYLENLHSSLEQPDLNILLDIDVEVSFTRRKAGREAYEQSKPRLRAAMKAYRELWKDMQSATNRNQWVIVDAEGTQEQTIGQIEQAVAAYRERVITDGLLAR